MTAGFRSDEGRWPTQARFCGLNGMGTEPGRRDLGTDGMFQLVS